MSGPTIGAADPIERSWVASRGKAWAVRLTIFVLPLLGAWLVVRSISSYLLRPDGWVGVVVWTFQALVISGAVATLLDRIAQRALPLATLLDMSLTFPDQAPSRFSIALRSGTVKQMQARLDAVRRDGLGNDAQTAATTAIEMVTILGKHDRLTRGHTERVRAYADVLAIQLELSTADRNRLAWGVLLHDVGKLMVPPEILNKDGRPTPEEWDILKQHPAEGAKLLEPLMGWLGAWGRAAGEHHERWDGKGYPLGLAGNDISLAGRITAVADAYDVITSRRSYKAPMSSEAARNELVRCAGNQFDETIVRAFLQASIKRNRRAGFFGWLPEAPRLAQLGSGAATTAVSAAVAVAVTVSSVVSPPSTTEPSSLAFAEVDGGAQESSATSSPPPGSPSSTTIATSGSDPSSPPSSSSTTSTAPATTLSTVIPGPPDSSTSVAPATPSTTNRDTTSTTAATTTSPTTTAPPTTSSTTTAAPTTTTTAAPTTTTTSTTTPPPTTTSTTSTTTSTTTTTTTTPTTTAPPPLDVVLYLANPGSGNTTSSPVLAFSTSPPTAGSLPNYDTDQDSGPGLVIKKDSAGLDTNDDTKRQVWEKNFANATLLDGRAKMSLSVAARDLAGGERTGFRVGLELCTPTCTVLGVDEWSGNSQSGNFRLANLDFGNVNVIAPAGSTLRLTVVAPDALTDTDIWIAYDTSSYDSELWFN